MFDFSDKPPSHLKSSTNSWNSPVLPSSINHHQAGGGGGSSSTSTAYSSNHAYSHSASSAISQPPSTALSGSTGVKFMTSVTTIGGTPSTPSGAAGGVFPAPVGNNGNVIANRNAPGFDQSELQQQLNKRLRQRNKNESNNSVMNGASIYESRLHDYNNDDDEDLYRT